MINWHFLTIERINVDTTLLLAPLRQTVCQHSTLLPLADQLANQHQSQVVARLAEAIRNRQPVRLLRYHSVHSNTMSNRLVEPHSFPDNFAQLTAYEPGTSMHKTQPPAEILTDAFNWPGEQKTVSLRLTYRAYHLLIEDYPLTRLEARPVPADADFSYRYSGQVRIDSPDEFRDYLRGRIEKFTI